MFTLRHPDKGRRLAETYGIQYERNLERVVMESEICILAVRPGQMKEVLEPLSKLKLFQHKSWITLLAGIPISLYTHFLGEESLELARAMPNLGVSVGEGMTSLCFSKASSREFQIFTKLFFASSGKVEELPETLMDVACGLAGSGPGFIFKLIEAAAQWAHKRGMPEPQALLMAAQTMLGAAKLVLEGQKPSELLAHIAVPGGTTEAGLTRLKALKLDEGWKEVLEEATLKSSQLGSVHS
jgi:pyrroline-5-carboxylate reductase